MVVVTRVMVVLEIIANKFAVVAVVVPVHVVIVVSDARAVGRLVVHVDVTAKEVVVLVLNSVVVKGGWPERGSHEIVRLCLTAVGVGRLLSRAPLPVKLWVVGTKGDGADLFEEVVAVGVFSVFRGLVLKAGVVHNRDAVRGPVGNPQLVCAAGMEFHVCWLIEVIGCIGDDHLNKTVAKGVHHLRVFSLGCVGREGEKEEKHEGKGDLLLHHTSN